VRISLGRVRGEESKREVAGGKLSGDVVVEVSEKDFVLGINFQGKREQNDVQFEPGKREAYGDLRPSRFLAALVQSRRSQGSGALRKLRARPRGSGTRSLNEKGIDLTIADVQSTQFVARKAIAGTKAQNLSMKKQV